MEKEIKHISGSAGGFLVGRSHANNGIKAINKATGQPLEMEGGEVVITKTAVEDEELREFEGEMLTNRQILSRINESGGGVSFALGGDIPTELYFDEKEYSYGGEKLPGHVIAYKISSCGCNQEPQTGLSEGKTIEDIATMHNVSVSHIENQIEKGIQVEAEHTSNPQEQVKIAMDHLVENPNYYDILAEANLEKGGELESFISEKFNEGFGKVKYFEISDFGGKWTYAKNPSMTRKQIESAPVYVIETSEQERNIAQEKRSNYEKSQPKEISIKEFSLKLAKENNLKITHVSKSGSVYLEKPNKETIRVSDHKILDRDPNNPKTRYYLEIVRNYFDENDSTNLSDYEETYAHGGNLKKISKIQKQEIIDSQNKFWESNDIYKLSSNGLNVLRKDNTKNPPKYKNYQSFEDFYSEILERETAKIERENATKVFDYLEQNGAELLNKSVYGSRYYYYKGNKVRVSDHWQTSEIKDSETGLNKYADLPSFYSDKPYGYKEMIEKIENLSNENYAFGGNLKKGAETDDLDNVVQVSDNVLDAPNIIPEQATLFAEGGQVINPIVEDWDDVPANYKNTNKVKKVNFANNPIDKGLDSIISPFLGNDVLRPIMGTIHFDKNGITATNAHVLITLPYPNEKYEGSYDINRIKKEKSSELLLLDETYPSYEKVIPLSENAKYVYKIDVYKLLQYAQTAINYSNKVTYQAVFKFGDNEKIGFNLNFLQIILKTWLKLGHEEIYVSMTMPNRAAVFSPSKNYEVGKDEIILLMPTMVGYGMKTKEEDIHFGAMDIDYGRHLKAYYDFTDGEIHNADGSIANFQMQYSNNLGISEDYLALLQKMTSKSRTLTILNYVKVVDGKMYATDLKTSLIVKNVDLKDGIYEIVNKAPNITMYPIEDFPKERVFNENEFQTIGNVFNGPNETPGEKRYSSFQFKISSEAFEFYLDKLLLSVGKDDLRPTMMGVCIHKTAENQIFLVSTDSNTLCKIDITEYCAFKKDDRKLEYIMSISYFKEAFDLIEGDITVKCSYSNVFIESENLDIISKNEDGKYPNYEAVIPYRNSNVIKFKHAEISKCLKEKPTLDFVNKYKSEKGKAFYITNSGEKIFLVLASESYGSANVSTIFDKLELCSIDLQYTEENTTVSFDDSLFLMMPMRLAAFENQYFAFKKSHFEIMLKTITDTEITCYYSEVFKPYLFPIEEVKFNKTLPEEKTKFQKDNVIVDKKVENKIKSTQKNQLPEVGSIVDFGEGLEKITRIATFSNGKEYIEAKRIDGSSERLNLYPLSDWENIIKNQDNFKKLREEREESIKERKASENEKILLENSRKNEYNDIDGFAENKTPLQKSKILKYLNSNFRNSSVKKEIRNAINNNGFIHIDKNGLESIRYVEFDKTYILNDKLQTKTALEYAKYLISINYNQLPDVKKEIGGNFSFKNEFGSFTSVKVMPIDENLKPSKDYFSVKTEVRYLLEDGTEGIKIKKMKTFPISEYDNFMKDLEERSKPLAQNTNEEIESTIEAINLILPSLRGKEKTEAKDTIVALYLLMGKDYETEQKINALKEKLSTLKDKLHDAKVEANQKFSNLGWGAGMRKSKLNVSTKKEDSIQARINKIEDELKSLQNLSSFEKGGPILLAPNGKPSNLDSEMYYLVRTPQFKAWFGDWENDPQNASKVVDKNGEPLIVYHGTNVEFNEFKSTKFPTAGYFAKDITYSKSFAKTITEYRKGKERLMNLFLNIRKPFDTSMLPGDKEYSDKELKKIFPIFKNIEWGENYIWGWMGKEDVINTIKENGYDGIIFNEMSVEYWKEYDFENEMENLKTVESYIAFEPNQIKLANGTNTTFDSNTNDIHYAKGGVINKEYNLEFKPIETPLN